MKRLFATCLSAFFTFFCFAQSDYQLQVGEALLDVEIGKEYHVTVNGKDVKLMLTQRDSLLYSDNTVRFLYPKGNSVSQTSIDKNVTQLSILNSEGAGFIIQKYASLNPETLVELMLKEVTKESINYGFVAERSVRKQSLMSGQEITIRKEVLRYKEEVNIYEITALGQKDSGIIVMTIRMDEEPNKQGEKICNMMWKTLQVTF